MEFSDISLGFSSGISPLVPLGISLRGFQRSWLNFLKSPFRDYFQNFFRDVLVFHRISSEVPKDFSNKSLRCFSTDFTWVHSDISPGITKNLVS